MIRSLMAFMVLVVKEVMVRFWGVLISLIMSLSLCFATGASGIISNIAPIAINSEGEILCKSFYSENIDGGRHVTDADLSLCIVKDSKIMVLQKLDQFRAAPETHGYEKDVQDYEALFNRYQLLQFSATSPLLEDQYEKLVQKGFKPIELNQYRLDPDFSAESFYEKWGSAYQDLKQVVLNSENRPITTDGFDINALLKIVKLQYQIGNQIWLSADDCPPQYEEANECNGDLGLDEGIRVMYYVSPLYHRHKDSGLYGTNPPPFGYELQKVNAIIFLPEI